MSINFGRINTGDDFELLCRDVLKSKGINILSNPAVGPDQGKDILIEIISLTQYIHQRSTNNVDSLTINQTNAKASA